MTICAVSAKRLLQISARRKLAGNSQESCKKAGGVNPSSSATKKSVRSK